MKNKLNLYLRISLSAVCILWAQTGVADIIQVTDPIAGTETWFHTNEYVLNSLIYVLDGAALNIEAGTVVRGKPGQDADTTALMVTAGGKIFANGTRAKPIIFTAEDDDLTDPDDIPIFQRGLWGGVVLMGKAVLNTTTDAAGNAATPKYEVFEGLPDAQINGQFVNRFGGDDDDDSSGIFRYVSIRHAGVVFQPDKELNGLSLGAVGRGTVIEHVEMYATADDGVEFFGGTVNTKYMVSAFNDDDCFDIDMGFRGKNQFWFAIQEPGAKDNGGEWNGEPNGVSVGANPIANWTIYNMTLVGAGTNTTGNRGLTIREYAAPRVYNSILTEFGGSAVRVDTKSAIHLTNGVMDLRDNIFWDFAGPLAETPEADVLFSDASRNNVLVNPMLAGISRSPDGGLDPRPLPGSPALSSPRTAPNDGFFTPVAYKGAFDDNDLWMAGWTFLSQKGLIPPRGANIVDVTDPISGTVNWYRTNEYVLNTLVYVLDGAVLNIEAGTVIKGLPGQDADTTALMVTRGGKIFANGTPDNPIIFTAEDDDVDDPTSLPLYQRGLWGGVVLMGKAVLNTTTDAAGNAATPKYEVFEGLPDAQVNGQFVNRFGGDDDDDSSGVLRYVSIRHAGVVFQPDKELNGLSLGGVGRGTVIEYVEMYATADDGVEFFGGTVNTKHMVSAFNDDDCFDIDMGFRGKNQFWFAIQEPGAKDNGGEWNGEPNGVSVGASPIANWMIYNMTLIGAGTNTTGNRGLTIREYAAPRVYNSILTEFGGSAVRIDNKSAIHLTNGVMDLRDNIFWDFAGPLAETPEADVLFSDASRNNVIENPMITSISRTTDFGLDPRPLPGSPALSSPRTAPNDGFFTPVAYKGAFDQVNWAVDWTALGALCVFSPHGAGTPNPILTPVVPSPELSVVLNGANVDISFDSQVDLNYQLQSATALANPSSATIWSDEGSAVAGTGGVITLSDAVGTGLKVYRVVVSEAP